MRSFVEQGSHVTSPQLTTFKQVLLDKRVCFEVGASALRPQAALAFTEDRSDAMALADPNGSMAFGTSSEGSSER